MVPNGLGALWKQGFGLPKRRVGINAAAQRLLNRLRAFDQTGPVPLGPRDQLAEIELLRFADIGEDHPFAVQGCSFLSDIRHDQAPDKARRLVRVCTEFVFSVTIVLKRLL